MTKPAQEHDDKFYTVAQIAQLFQVRPATVREWLSSGSLKGIKPGGRQYRIAHTEFVRFANEKFGDNND